MTLITIATRFIPLFVPAAFALAAEPRVVELWPAMQMPGDAAKEAEKEVPSRGDGFHRITNISRPTLTIFPADKKDAPAVIICPGGGYGYVVIDKEGTEIAAWLNKNGYTALVLKYRTPNNRAGAFQDIQRAISLTRENSARWEVAPSLIGAIGFSAGGHLVARASTQFDSRSYAAVDGADSKSCRPDFVMLVYPAYLADKAGRTAPELNLKSMIPPTLIIHNEDDRSFVAGSKIYAAALAGAKVVHDFKIYATGGHGYGLHCTGEAKEWPKAALDWLERNAPK